MFQFLLYVNISVNLSTISSAMPQLSEISAMYLHVNMSSCQIKMEKNPGLRWDGLAYQSDTEYFSFILGELNCFYMIFVD